MDKIRVSAVSYTNTKPFTYGIEHTGVKEAIDLSLDIPSTCAQKLIENKADIGLVPVAALLQIPDYQIYTDYCIGSVGPVNSVFIFSHKPAQEIHTLRLDAQSRTSNNLARVLLKNYWKREIELTTGEDADAFVEIGDRTFGKKDKYPYVYDMGEEWMKFTGLPFTYAVWAANKVLPDHFVAQLNEALRYGLDHRDEVLKELPQRDDFDLDSYLKQYLNYDLTPEKREAIARFHAYIKAL